jgi:hypothetical protein
MEAVMKTANRALLSLAALAAVGCQTYDFEPVTPLAIAQTTQARTVTAKNLKPDMMILLDKSGSMNIPINPPNTGCADCAACGQPANCATRLTEMRRAMDTFLTNSGRVARMGLTIYPQGNFCAAAGASEQLVSISPMSDSDADLQSHATTINARIQAQAAAGGTPTGDSLRFVGTLPELNNAEREDFVLLLTDGLPNCNGMNPNTCLMPTTCNCTLSACGNMLDDSNPNNLCRRGCLDQDGAVQAIRELRSRSIRTIVVGFGSDLTGGAGYATLNAMAVAGGFSRTCPMGTDAECGTGNTCLRPSNVCNTAFYAAGNSTELAAALAQISDNLMGDSICRWTLEAQPSSTDLLSVLIDGTATPAGPDTWELQSGVLVFQGALCDKFKASTSANPVKVEVRIVQSL